MYNAEYYIGDCLNSIIHQTYNNIEVIIIDDGSNDNSINIVRQYCRIDSRFNLYIKENGGASSARNLGILYAIGDYIQFLDDDDILPGDSIENMIKVAIRHDSDIIVGNTLCFSNNGIYLYRFICSFENQTMKGCDFFCHVMHDNNFVVMLYNYIYKRSYIIGFKLQFDINLVHEDELWTPVALILAPTITYSSVIHYYYRRHQNSIISKCDINRIRSDVKYISKRLNNFIVSNDFNGNVCSCIDRRIKNLYSYISSLSHIKKFNNEY